MRHRCEWSLLAALFVTLGSTSAHAGSERQGLIVWDGPAVAAEHTALARAVELLPGRPSRVAVIDAHRARPEVRDELLRLDAFVVRGSAVVYVVRQSALLQGAAAGSSIHVHALAAVIWHEVAHAGGADEREAREREQALWTSFIRDQRVEGVLALRYLAAMERRPDDQLVARSSP